MASYGSTFTFTFRKYDGGLDLIDLAQNKDKWRAYLNVITKTVVT